MILYVVGARFYHNRYFRQTFGPQVTAAKQAVAAASQNPENSPELQAVLDDTSNTLQEMEDTIIEEAIGSWADALTANNAALSALNTRIDELLQHMEDVSATVRAVSNTVATVVTVVAAAVSAGVL